MAKGLKRLIFKGYKRCVEYEGKSSRIIFEESHKSINFILIWLEWLSTINKRLLLPTFFVI